MDLVQLCFLCLLLLNRTNSDRMDFEQEQTEITEIDFEEYSVFSVKSCSILFWQVSDGQHNSFKQPTWWCAVFRYDLDSRRNFSHGFGRVLPGRAAGSRSQRRWFLDRPPHGDQRKIRAFVAATGYATLAERPLNAADYPGAPVENLVPGSMRFYKTAGAVDEKIKQRRDLIRRQLRKRGIVVKKTLFPLFAPVK